MQKAITIPKINISNTIMLLDVVALMFCITVFERYEYGRYFFFAFSLIAYLVCLYQTGGKMKLPVGEHQLHFLSFILAVLLSSLWAIDPSDPIQKVVSLVEILLCFYGFYCYFYLSSDVALLLKAIKWAGFLIAIYSLIFYGYDTMVNAGTSEKLRLDNEFANINSISNMVAISCLLEFYDFMNKKDRLLVLLYVPSFIVILACQSRKTFLFLFLGFLGLIVMLNRSKKNVLGIAAGLVTFFVVFIIMSKMQAFEGMFNRVETLLNMYNGEGKVDGSSLLRQSMNQVGFYTWLDNPIGGTGIGCSHYLTSMYLGRNTYLHNNYVELLSGGGLIAFVAYYWFHFYLLYKIIKVRKNDPSLYSLALVWMLLIMIMDYGMVTYSSKTQWFTLMTMYLIYIKMKAKGTKNEPIEQTEQLEKAVPVYN